MTEVQDNDKKSAMDFLRDDLPIYKEQLFQLDVQKREAHQKLAELQNFCKQLDQNIEITRKRVDDVERILGKHDVENT